MLRMRPSSLALAGLALAAPAHASPHSEDVGSTTSDTTLEDKWAAQFYEATTTATLTGVSFWGYERVTGSTGTVTAYLWTRTSSGSWTATNLGNISVTSTTPARFSLTLATPQTLTAGQTYGIGFSSDEAVYTQGYWSGDTGDTGTTDTGDTGTTDTGDTGTTDTGTTDTADTGTPDSGDTGDTLDTTGSSRRRTDPKASGCASTGPAPTGLLAGALAAGLIARRRRR
jgi:MYXO-CTERM domain-containing protein